MIQNSDHTINTKKISADKYIKFLTYIIVIQTVYLVFAAIPGVNIILKLFSLPVLVFLWFLPFLLIKKLYVKKWMIFGVLWLLYMFIIGYLLNDFASRSRLLTDGSLFFFMIIMNNYLKDKKFNELSRIGKFSVAGIVLTIIYSYFMLLKYPMLARDTASGQAGSLGVGIAGYDYIYGLVALIPMVTIKIIESIKNKYQKTFLTFSILFIFSFLYIIKSQFTTAFLLFILGTILGLMFLKKISTLYKIAYVFLIIGFIFFILNIVDILQWISNEIPSNVMRVRIEEIVNVIEMKDFTASDRLVRMHSTLNAFLKYPFGAVFYGARFLSDTLGVDFHTEWLNVLAYYGWQGLLLFTAWILTYIKETVWLIKQHISPKYIYIQIIMIFITGLFNPIHFAAGYYFISFFLSTALIFIGYYRVQSVQILEDNHCARRYK